MSSGLRCLIKKTLKEENCDCSNNAVFYTAERPSVCENAASCRHVYK
jgi:hypothetical protein